MGRGRFSFRGPRPAPSFTLSSKLPKKQAWIPTLTLFTPSPRSPIFERLEGAGESPNSHPPISNNKCRYHLTAHRFDAYGRWEGRYIKDRVDGKARYAYVFGKSYEDALSKLLQAASQTTDAQNQSTITFGAVSTEWLDVQTPELKASSVVRYRNLLNSYILPRFSKSVIQEIQRGEKESKKR